MARSPKTNTTSTENKEATKTEGEATATDQINEGADSPDEPVKDPDGNPPDPDATPPEPIPDSKIGELEAANQDLNSKLDQANDDLITANNKIDELNTQINELLEAPSPDQERAPTEFEREDSRNQSRMARGYLLGVVMAMPENYRLNGLAAKLDELEAFVSEFEGEDRYIAVELIKSIAQARPNDIPNGRYLIDVRRAFAVLDGESEATIDATANRDEQNAAYNRLASVVGASPVPAGFVADRREREDQPTPVMDGTDEQNAAAARFANAAG